MEVSLCQKLTTELLGAGKEHLESFFFPRTEKSICTGTKNRNKNICQGQISDLARVRSVIWPNLSHSEISSNLRLNKIHLVSESNPAKDNY